MFKHLRIQAALGALVLGSALVAPLNADALTSTGTMTVTTGVVASCTTSATTADLGTWTFTAASTASSTITVTCTQGAAVSSVGLDNGLHVNTGIRQMRGAGTADIGYNVFQDATFATAWTDAAWPALATYTAVVAPAVFTAYVKAPAGPNVIAGTYTDTVNITVTYS
jgi:spore coat protein U-like protein